MPKLTELALPPCERHPSGNNTISSTGVILIVGANGSGKTRLGSWIEFNAVDVRLTHRISAQKSLMLPESTRPMALEKAESDLLFGYEDARENPGAYRSSQRWKQHPNTHLLTDFEQLMVYLFSDEVEKNALYKRAQRESPERIEPPETKLDIMKGLWERTLPRRELIIGGAKVETRTKSGAGGIYNGSEMSDGERVIFYLAGQALSAPKDGVIIVDEPELHLHKSIQSKLWDEIEAERPDCLFVYLTHDLDFATTRLGATKVWLKDFDGEKWDWDLVPETQVDGIPEEMLLEIIGSRKPILFIEGERSSLDHLVFTHLYPEWNVTPCGGCTHVLNATQSFESLNQLHDLSCRGIVDRDIRSADEVRYLRERNIFVLEFAEVENLFLLEDVLRIAAKELLRPEDEILVEAKRLVLGELEREKEKTVSAIVAHRIESAVRNFDAKSQGEAALQAAAEAVWKGLNIGGLYQEALQQVDVILEEENYTGALQIYANKGLVSRIGAHFKHKDFKDYLRRLLISDRGGQLVNAMLRHAPQIRI